MASNGQPMQLMQLSSSMAGWRNGLIAAILLTMTVAAGGYSGYSSGVNSRLFNGVCQP